MHILAFDTCLGAVSVAVARADPGRHGELMHEACERRRSGHAERLMPMIIAAHQQRRYRLCGHRAHRRHRRPGQFHGRAHRGRRARALALAIGRPAVGVGSLAAIAFAAEPEFGRAARAPAWRLRSMRALAWSIFSSSTPRRSAERPSSDAARLRRAVGGSPHRRRIGAVPVIEGTVARMAQRSKRGCPRQSHAQPRLPCWQSSLRRVNRLQPLYLRAPDAKPQADGVLPRASA